MPLGFTENKDLLARIGGCILGLTITVMAAFDPHSLMPGYRMIARSELLGVLTIHIVPPKIIVKTAE